MTRRHWMSLTVAACLPVVLSVGPAGASLVLALDLPEMTAAADHVVVGEVMSVKSAWNRSGRSILTTVEVSVAEVWKGEMPRAGRLTIVQSGGSVGNIEMRVHGAAQFTQGERAVLFLRGTDAPSVVGMGQGKRPLRLDPASARWMVEAGDRSAAIRLDGQGHTQPAPPETPLPLDELRRRVKSLVKR